MSPSSSKFETISVYRPISSVGMVLAVEVGLADGLDSMSVFIIHPSWNTEHGDPPRLGTDRRTSSGL